MVNLQGKESTALKTIQQSLNNNLNIIPSDSRLKTINDKIADSRYRIKDLSTTLTAIRCNKITIIDGKVFLLPTNAYSGTIEVRNYQNDTLLKTINDGSNTEATAICFDTDYIYISKCVQRITDKKYRDVYVRKYNRCTLEFISESPVLYTGVSAASSANSSNIFEMIENGEYLYLACVQIMETTEIFHKIRKIKKTDFSSTAYVAWATPLNIIKHANGFFVLGANVLSSDEKYRRIELLDWDLNITQTFPQTTLTNNNFRNGFYKDDFLYVCNDSAVLVKYQISTNTIAAEMTIPTTFVRNIILINNNFLLLQTNTAKIILYDLNLNSIKTWDFFGTTLAGGYLINDNNNTIWTHPPTTPTTIYKKQFIDMTSNIT